MCQCSCLDEGTGEFSHSKHSGAPLQIKKAIQAAQSLIKLCACQIVRAQRSDLRIDIGFQKGQSVTQGLWCEILNNTDAHWL